MVYTNTYHTLDDIKAVEDSEHIHAVFCCQANELLHYIIRIRGVAHRVRTA